MEEVTEDFGQVYHSLSVLLYDFIRNRYVYYDPVFKDVEHHPFITIKSVVNNAWGNTELGLRDQQFYVAVLKWVNRKTPTYAFDETYIYIALRVLEALIGLRPPFNWWERTFTLSDLEKAFAYVGDPDGFWRCSHQYHNWLKNKDKSDYRTTYNNILNATYEIIDIALNE